MLSCKKAGHHVHVQLLLQVARDKQLLTPPPCQAKIQPQTGLKMANVAYTEEELCTMLLRMVTSNVELAYLAINPGKFPIDMDEIHDVLDCIKVQQTSTKANKASNC